MTIDLDEVSKYAKALGIEADGEEETGFINEVLDGIYIQFEYKREHLPAEAFEHYKAENQDMLKFYMANKDYGQTHLQEKDQ